MRHLSVEVTADDGRRVKFDHAYLSGWLEVDRHGNVTAYDLDTSVASLAHRAGQAVAEKMPRAHRAYVGAATRIVTALGGKEKAEAAITKCKAAGKDGGECEHLRDFDGDYWCGKCGCPKALKKGCPENRWSHDDG